MSTLTIKNPATSSEMDRESMSDIHGGRMKIIGQPANGTVLTLPDGEPSSAGPASATSPDVIDESNRCLAGAN